MELYNKEFVYFDWDDNLEGKEGFFADNIETLKQHVKNNDTSWFGEICKYSRSDDDDIEYPFETIDNSGWHRNFRFCYYDPYYELRKAYLEGKQLQFKKGNGEWEDVVGDPVFKGAEYRIKPKMWYIVLDDFGLSRTNLKEDDVLFEGTEEECIERMKIYKPFEKILLAHRQGKTIQYKEDDKWINWMLNSIPRDGAFVACKEWRIKDESTKLVPFDTVHELVDAWDEKYPQNKNRPKGTMPLIWIKNKEKNRVYLITDFLFEKIYDYDVGTSSDNLTLKGLFENYTFADGSIIGKVKE